jgi:hypothetical protein
MNRTVSDLLNQKNTQLLSQQLPQIKKRKTPIIDVLFPAHSFVVATQGYGKMIVKADPSIDFGTFSRPKVSVQGLATIEYNDTTGTWHATGYETTNRCLSTATVNVPNIPLPTYTPIVDSSIVFEPFRVDTNFSPFIADMGKVSPFLMPSLGTDEEVYSVSGGLSVSTGQLRLYNRSGVPWQLGLIYISVGTAPTGDNIIVDVKNSGSTIFTTPANRPTITAGSYTGVSALPPDLPIVAVGEYLTVDILQVGATIPGSDLVTQFPMVR